MHKTLIDVATNNVSNIIVLNDNAEWTAPEGQFIGPDDGWIGDTWDGSAYIKPQQPDPPPPTQADYKIAIQSHVDATASARNYTDGNSCASYANSTVPQWAAEAVAFVAWRDSVWAYAFEQLALVQSAEREQPTIDELVSELPAMAWPVQH